MRSVKPGKLSRALGIALTAKGAKCLDRRPFAPGQHGKAKRPQRSNFGNQLLEKQRLKAQYHVTERQLQNYYAKARRLGGEIGPALIKLLESRLDALVLRSGFAPTIYSARQLVSHGHILVNGTPVNAPGYTIKIGTTLSPRSSAVKGDEANPGKTKVHPLIDLTFGQANRPGYLSVVSVEAKQVKLDRVPDRREIPIICEENLVVEFYSR